MDLPENRKALAIPGDGDHLSSPPASSRTAGSQQRDDVAIGVQRPTRGWVGPSYSPYSALLQVGFDRRYVTADDRTLLPSDFNLTAGPDPFPPASPTFWSKNRRRCVSVPLSVPHDVFT